MQDLRFALRMLARNPGFTAVALLALALGIGATTALFSIVNSILLRPLPFPHPERLVMVWESVKTKRNNVVQTGNFLEWRRRNRSFEDIAAFVPLPVNVAGRDEPVQVRGLNVTAGFFEIVGVKPLLGRVIAAADDLPGTAGVAVLSYGMWQRWFGGRTETVGQKIRVNGASTEIIGVMPEGFEYPTHRAEIYIAMRIQPDQAVRDGRNFSTVARLRPGVSVAAAQSEMSAIAAQLAVERPKIDFGWNATVVPLLEQTVGQTRTTLRVLLGAVLFVLLIACANVSNLLLMRASKRRREMLVRIALGAGRWRLLRQLMVESVLLAVAGGLLGFVLAWWGVPALVKMLPAGFPLPRLHEITVDRTMLGFTILVSVACGMFFGIFPALQLNRARISAGLHHGGRGGTASNRGVRNALVIAEVAVAVLLVIGAGLMVRSFNLLTHVDPGFRPEHLLTFRMLLLNTGSSFEQVLAHRAAVIEQTLDRVRRLPMLTAASSIHILPMTNSNSGSGYFRSDRPEPAPGQGASADFSVISDGYFKTMGIPMLAGREFDRHDRTGSVPVVVLNQTLAQIAYPGESPVGKRLRVYWGSAKEVEIIGVAADIHHWGLGVSAQPCIFIPQAQQPSGFASLVVRTAGDPSAAIAAVKEQLHAVDPNQGVQDISTMESVISDSTANPKLQMTVMGAFGMLALALACLGIYAVISYSVEQRAREMGIRLALGATPMSILRMVAGEGLGLAGVGIAIGLAAAIILTRYLATLLYTVRPTDPLVYAGVSVLLASIALAGCYVPARRATRVDPNTVLREE